MEDRNRAMKQELMTIIRNYGFEDPAAFRHDKWYLEFENPGAPDQIVTVVKKIEKDLDGQNVMASLALTMTNEFADEFGWIDLDVIAYRMEFGVIGQEGHPAPFEISPALKGWLVNVDPFALFVRIQCTDWF